ncbi:MAG: alpha-ketoacid dehydrogenase subunit beta [Gemmatimonadetes bacterium]|nr:alpha-ketoacid dehydrogenase subunit beta [Gemmatimonadota bacterium]
MAQTTYLQAIHDALREEMLRDESVFCLGEDIGTLGGAFKATDGLLDEFGPLRMIDTPIAESLIVGAAVGAALQGQRPVAEMQFMDFITCGFDQLVNMTATLRYRHGGQPEARVPMVVRGPSGSGVTGALFHSQNPEAWFFRVPGLKIVCPATVYDAKGLLKAAIRDEDPVLYFEHKRFYRSLKEDLPEGDIVVPLGRAALRREGRDLTMITYGGTVHQCVEAAERLESEDGVLAEVLDLRTVYPLDMDAVLASVRKCSKVMVVHEDRLRGGIGGEIVARIAEHAFDALDGPILRVGMLDTHNAFATEMEQFILPNTERILTKARQLAAY